MEAGGLLDAYRELIGEEDATGFSWRGVPSGKYGGRGMRIDHCVVARSLLASIVRVDILGYGAERTGFLGSDHSPILITCRGDKSCGKVDIVEGDSSVGTEKEESGHIDENTG